MEEFIKDQPCARREKDRTDDEEQAVTRLSKRFGEQARRKP
ncbi:hypothetical protein [Nonomuraea basaltis]|nr:hypothetical protein [Nonomuraea basaltis]